MGNFMGTRARCSPLCTMYVGECVLRVVAGAILARCTSLQPS